MHTAAAYPFRAPHAAPPLAAAAPPPPQAASWVWLVVAFFVLLGIWMYVTNTSHIRRMAIVKAQLRTQVHTTARLLSWPAAGEPPPELCLLLEGSTDDAQLFLMDREGQVWADAANPRRPEEQVGPRPSVLGVEQEEERVVKPIEKLVQLALQGGGFHTHPWRDASSSEMKPRLTYVAHIPGTEFILGCGYFV